MEKIKENTIRIIAIFILFIVIFVAIFYMFYYDNPYTTTYENIEAEEAYNLIKNSSVNLTVIDIRGLEDYSIDQFNEGHLPYAIFNDTASDFFESKNITVKIEEIKSMLLYFVSKNIDLLAR